MSADHIAFNGIYIRNIIFISADAEVKIYIVFVGNLVQFLNENREAFKSNVRLLQYAVDENGFDIVIAGNHAVKKSYKFFNSKNIGIISNAFCPKVKVYRLSMFYAFFDEYDVSIGSFHLFVCKINHLLCFSAASRACY